MTRPIAIACLCLPLALAACDKEQAAADPTEPAVASVKGLGDGAPPSASAGQGPAAASKPEALPGKVYGAGVSVSEAVPISKLLADPDAWVGKKVRVEGLVVDVCARRGCWFKMAADVPGETVRFKVKDGTMVFPMDAKGKYAVAEGVVRKIPLDLEQTRRVLAHEAEEKGEAFDSSEVKEPLTLVRLDGLGAVIRDKK